LTKVAIISGSSSVHSRLNGIENEVISFLKENDFSIEQVRVIDLPPEDLIHAKYDSEEIKKTNKKIEEADAIVVLTPVFKAAYSGVLKAYLDLLPQKAFVHKPILPIVIGGSPGHLLVIDYALKPVFNALGATITLKGVYVIDSMIERLPKNQFRVDVDAKERLHEELSILVNLLRNGNHFASSLN